MSENAQKAYESMESLVGLDPVAGDWFELTQERINDFADTTLDHQFTVSYTHLTLPTIYSV